MPEIIGDPDNLLTAITHLAESEAHKKIEEAKEKAESIQDEAEQEAKEERERILKEARRKAQSIRKRGKSQKAREANLEFLQTREETLQDVWVQAEKELRDLIEQDAEYLETLKSLALLGARILRGESFVLYPDSNGRDLLTEEQLANWSEEAGDLLDRKVNFMLADDDADIWGGMIIGMEGTNRRVDASFKTRLQIARDEIQNTILKQLTKS